MGRAAIEEDVVGGYRIPAGGTVFVCPFVTHRDPRFWENPEGFDPDRFSPEKVAARPKFAYFPFGGGPRVCIGDSLAKMQMQIIVAMIAQRYRLDLAPSLRIGLAPKMTLVPRNRVQVTAHPRRVAAEEKDRVPTALPVDHVRKPLAARPA
jgi:cytochrome P450